VHEAAARALANEEPCELRHIRDRLLEVYEEHEAKEDGATSSMEELCRFPLFEPKLTPAEFFQKSWIIKLPPNVPEDSRTIVVNLLLDALDQHLNGLVDAETSPDGARGLRILCMIDEAHQILGTRLPSLSRLIRMSRSKGGAVMLVSQSPDDFSGEDDEFLDNMGLVAAFATNAKPGAAARVLGKGANLTNLQTGQCFVRFDKTTRKIKAW
ncbi:MAG: type IV secretory system conjugative DNA transfer family protein, partial [Parvularcula sp.]|nr:type IV secretory system conjugative DNA transfer family protein [Parvularcula sp.]